ncbi:MAG TPA: hypothetical protein VF486_06650 [Actinomycetes bacterium]
MESSDPNDVAHQGPDTPAGRAQALADQVRPLLGSEGFSDERIDELADAFVSDRVGEGPEQFISWAIAEGPIGLDPEEGF